MEFKIIDALLPPYSVTAFLASSKEYVISKYSFECSKFIVSLLFLGETFLFSSLISSLMSLRTIHMGIFVLRAVLL